MASQDEGERDSLPIGSACSGVCREHTFPLLSQRQPISIIIIIIIITPPPLRPPCAPLADKGMAIVDQVVMS